MAQCDRAAACRERSDPSYRRGFGVPSSVPKWRATVDEDGHYAFAVALWCGSLRHAAPSWKGEGLRLRATLRHRDAGSHIQSRCAQPAITRQSAEWRRYRN